jgi:hypothetical protein
MRRLTLSIFLLAAAAANATVYKWVDDKGVVHYSDQPHPGAEKVQVAPAQTYSAPAPPARSTAPAQQPAPTSDAGNGYRVCAITRPGNDEIYLNPSEVVATVKLDPALREGHRVVVELDGKPVAGGPPGGAGNYTLKPIARGTHQLTLRVVAPDNRAVCQAMSTFHVRQPSVFSPNNPNNPNRPKPR